MYYKTIGTVEIGGFNYHFLFGFLIFEYIQLCPLIIYGLKGQIKPPPELEDMLYKYLSLEKVTKSEYEEAIQNYILGTI